MTDTAEVEEVLICSECEADISRDYAGEYYVNEANEDICPSCWDESVFYCCRCDESEWVRYRDGLGDVLVVVDDTAGLAPGLYLIREHPYFTQGLLGGGWVWDSAVLRLGFAPDVDTDGYPCGHVCRCCKAELLSEALHV